MKLKHLSVSLVVVASCSQGPSAGDHSESQAQAARALSGATSRAGTDAGEKGKQCVARADRPSTDTGWTQGLTVGPNGPIPVIVVDQFGYRTHAEKVAVIRDPQVGYDSAVDFTPGRRYAVVEKATGAIVKRGSPKVWNGGATDPSSGDKAWWFDFSDVTKPGLYTVVDLERGMRSVEFEIDDDVYRSVLRHAVRMYFYQRAGFEKTAATAGAEWADGASHLGPGQDPEAHSWDSPSDATLVKDLRGGWYDAGDYNKYTSWTAHNVRNLLRAYEENPAIFGDDFGIAESHNGVPDLLDEAKWGLDWVVRMQNDDGSLLCILGLAKGSPPSSATGPSYYGPATTAATLSGALSFAYASKVYGKRPEPRFKAYAAELARRAKKAWAWAEANPNVLYYNNDGELQPGSDGLGGGQQETDDDGRLFDKLEAAIYLYELTGEAEYKSFVEANYEKVLPIAIPTIWGADKQDAVLYYSQLKGVSKRVRTAIVNQFLTDILNKPDQFPTATAGLDPYRSPLSAFYWGSNFTKAQQGRAYEQLARFTKDRAIAKQAMAVAEGYLHYINGVNPLGLVYLTNMKRAGAEHSAKTMFHHWFTEGSPRWDEVSDTTPGPAPGYLVGGPSIWYAVDSCCTDPPGSWDYQCNDPSLLPLCNLDYSPPLGQPDQKMYLQFNMDTPGDSYIVTEPSTGYQAEFILFLSRFIE